MKNKLIKFSLLFLIQIFISTIIIVFFQQRFLLKPIIIVGHLFVVFCINLSIILLGFIVYSNKLIKFLKITKYLIPSLYGIFAIILYYTYVFAFLGESFNSRIYTLQLVLGYLKHLNGLLSAFSISPLLVYTALFIIPLFILVSFLFLTKFINQGFHAFKQFILYLKIKTPSKHIRLIIVFSTILVGLASAVVFVKRAAFASRLFRMEEPVVSVFFKNYDPFQGQTISNNNEDARIRNDYPKNIGFQKKNIVIIVIDALRSDHLSLYGYHRKTSRFLDSLYASGHLRKIESSFSVAAASFAGINGILRSKIWANMGYNNFSLQQLLKDQGYEINFLVSGDHTHFYGLKSFYGNNSDFNYYIDGSTTKKYIVNDDRIIFEGLENIADYHNNPSYLHFHLNSAHDTGNRLDKYKVFRPANANQLTIENYTNRYDNGIIQADDYVKEIFNSLSSKGYLQNSIVVITADHGEALGERGEFGHVKNVYTDQILIPILIYDTDSVQYKNMTYATSVDIAPTIVDRLGIPIPKTWEGNSLYKKKPREFTFHQMGEDYAIIHTKENFRFKYVYNNTTHKEELFELNSDLYEKNNIIGTRQVKYVNSLRNKLSQFHLKPFK